MFANFGRAEGIGRDPALARRHLRRLPHGSRAPIEREGKRTGNLLIRRNTGDLARALVAKFSTLGVALIGALAARDRRSRSAWAATSRSRSRPRWRPRQRSRDGDLSVEVPENASGELGELARAFNTMTAGLRA